MNNSNNPSKAAKWTGYTLKMLLILFLLFDAGIKIIKNIYAVEGTKQLGLPESCIVPLGIYLLMATILFIFPRTMIFGSLFITAYLGGATAITYASHQMYVFPIVFCALIWITTLLLNPSLINVLIPRSKQSVRPNGILEHA